MIACPHFIADDGNNIRSSKESTIGVFYQKRFSVFKVVKEKESLCARTMCFDV